MTDPATLAPGELAEAVMRAMGWTHRWDGWHAPDGTMPTRLDFHSEAERWRSFGVVLAECERRGIRANVDCYTDDDYAGACVQVRLCGDGAWEQADAVSGAPIALAVAFLRASAQDGGAG